MRLNKMFNPLAIRIGASALAIVAAFSLGWSICSLKNDSQFKTYAEEQNKITNDLLLKNKNFSDQAEAFKLQIKKLQEVQNEPIKKEIREVPIYRDCIVPDNGLRLLNDKAAAKNQNISTK